MNVYVRELVGALAQAGMACDVYTRAWTEGLPPEVVVEPGFRVVHVPAGPIGSATKDDLIDFVDDFADGVISEIAATGDTDAIHANYWLSGVAGHAAKHALGLPLVSTFHTLARVKAEVDEAESLERVHAEADVIRCSDAILANCEEEADDLRRHYDAPADRIEIVPPGVDHAFFSPGDRDGARAALGWTDGWITADGGRGAVDHPVLLFVGRIQPLKGLDVAVSALAELERDDAELVIVGGPSGAGGPTELERVRSLADDLGVRDRIRWIEPQPHHLLSTWYRAADVVLVPSRSESFGTSPTRKIASSTPMAYASPCSWRLRRSTRS
jgi:D-inositol-3-phosphate glycosyltransferase